MSLHTKVESCARAAHEANRTYCLTLGDRSQPHWETAPEWQRTSAINGVMGIIRDGNTPAQSHASWLDEKRRTGWKYGPVKDAEKREHPCFMPYDELPPEQRKKDLLFHDTVHAMAKVVNLTVADFHVNNSKE